MISKEVYGIINKAPRNPGKISYSELKELSPMPDEDFYCRLMDAQLSGYIDALEIVSRKGDISLTEKGATALEDYAQREENTKLYRRSLVVAIIAAVAAIINAVVAIFDANKTVALIVSIAVILCVLYAVVRPIRRFVNSSIGLIKKRIKLHPKSRN